MKTQTFEFSISSLVVLLALVMACRPGHSGDETASGVTSMHGTSTSSGTTSIETGMSTMSSSSSSTTGSSDCVGDDDCDLGYTCVGYPLFLQSQCVVYCLDGEDMGECPGGSRCLVVEGKPTCAPVCDPRGDNECEGGCRPVDATCPGCFPMTSNGTFSCWFPPPTEYEAGFPCPFGECADSFFCAPPGRVLGCDEITPCCTQYCTLGDSSCPQGTTCVPVFDDGQAPESLSTLGACLTP